MEETKRVTGQQLYNIAYKTFLHLGLSEGDAHIGADVLSLSDRRGVFSHGLNRLSVYVKQIETGAEKAGADPIVLKETPSTLTIDANNGLGIVNSAKIMAMTIEKAKQSGICLSSVRNSAHSGMFAYYPLMAAKEGLFGMCAGGSAQIMVPYNGSEPVMGNNPFSIAFPAGSSYPHPVLLDMACSEAATGKIELAARAGKKIPLTWIVDQNGTPTDDPNEMFKRFALMPFGGAKGYCISVFVELISAVLAGTGFAGDTPYDNASPDRAGYFFMAMDLGCFRPIEDIRRDIDRYTEMIKAVPPRPGASEVFLPGEIEERNMARHDAEGIDYDMKLLRELTALLASRGILPPDADVDDLLAV